jgi:hypothetical protein
MAIWYLKSSIFHMRVMDCAASVISACCPHKLADILGMPMNRLRRIRDDVIKPNLEEIQSYGSLPETTAMIEVGKGAKRAVTEYWLTEPQALAVCSLSRAPNAKAVRKMLIQVFMAWRRGQLVSVELPVAAIVEEMTAEVMRCQGGMVKAIVKKQVGEAENRAHRHAQIGLRTAAEDGSTARNPAVADDLGGILSEGAAVVGTPVFQSLNQWQPST